MKRARGKEVYIITAVLAVVIAVAWYFLLLSPTRTEIAEKTEQVQVAEANLNAARQQVTRLEAYKKTAPQSRAEIVRLGKMLPVSEGIPSLIVELTKTASSAGVGLIEVTRGESTPGTPFGIQAVNVQVRGRFFEVEDFLHRVESYVAFNNAKFRVTGRLLQVANVNMDIDADSAKSTTTSPLIDVTIVLNAYLWGGSASTAATAGGAT